MYNIKSGSSTTTVVWENGEKVKIDERLYDADILSLGEGHYHFLLNHQSYNVELISFDRAGKQLQLKLNGTVFNLEVKDKFDVLLEKMGLASAGKAKVSELKAPMPGLVIDIRVEVGQQVAKGDPILLLEAMKMENIIKSPVDAVIKKIAYQKGDAVEKGAVLVSFE